jgi:hypothetical protein
LSAGSPAIDAGLDTPLAGRLDLYSAPRRQGRAIDIGAVEHSAGHQLELLGRSFRLAFARERRATVLP